MQKRKYPSLRTRHCYRCAKDATYCLSGSSPHSLSIYLYVPMVCRGFSEMCFALCGGVNGSSEFHLFLHFPYAAAFSSPSPLLLHFLWTLCLLAILHTPSITSISIMTAQPCSFFSFFLSAPRSGACECLRACAILVLQPLQTISFESLRRLPSSSLVSGEVSVVRVFSSCSFRC
jgi:hypothetical protein